MSTEKIRMTYREGLRQGLRDALRKDANVFLMGEDVGRYGGSYAVSREFLAEFGPDRVRDTPLSESAFVGAGIGSALGGARPIVEIMTVNFSLLALDQIINNAASLLHMSGGQFNVPLVIRIGTGAGRQLAAQHSHSFEGWYAHIPGIRILTPATVEDARGMIAGALLEPNPVLIFEHVMLLSMEAEVEERPPHVDIDFAKVRREGEDLSLITYGGSLPKALEAAEILEKSGVSAEVLDLRTLRPLDDASIQKTIQKTGRGVIIDEGWRSGSLSSEISARISEQAFSVLKAPIVRICTKEVPIPYPRHLEEAALPSVKEIVDAGLNLMGKNVRI